MKNRILFTSLSLLLLSACGAVYDGPTQRITLLTPGAQHARCTLESEDFKYQMETDETRSIMRSEDQLVVSCMAPGNREKTILVDRELTDAGLSNIANLGAGALYDYYDNSLYGYPEVIVVDFTAIAPRSYGLPKSHAPDLPHPTTTPIPSYGPTTPITDQDRLYPQPVLQKKDMGMGDEMGAMNAMSMFTPEPSSSDMLPMATMPSPRGETAEDLTRSMNPTVFGQ